MKHSHSLICLLAAAVFTIAPATAPAKDPVATAKPSANLDLARQLNEAFVSVAEQVSPAVVVINVTQKATSAPYPSDPGQDDGSNGNGDGNDPFEQFRKRFFRQLPMPPEHTHGQGSGIIIRADGYILTNRHVVEDAEKIEVRLKDGRTFPAEVRGVDAPSDVAVVKILATNLPAAKLADSSQTRVGEFAIAIGAPFALDYSVTFGHVSAKDRSNIIPDDEESLPTMLDQEFIQTDANINPGNSGGPLVNIQGEVIGVNTLIRGLHTGIGFAIPSNLAKQVADELIEKGKFTRAWLGVNIVSLREYPIYKELVKGVDDGVVVKSLVPNAPASKSDLRPGDVITAVDSKTVVTSQQLKDEIRSKKVGDKVVLDVVPQVGRNAGKHVSVTVRPGEWSDKEASAKSTTDDGQGNKATASLGISVKPLTRELADQFGVDLAEGVIVTSVDKRGLAADYIKPGDIVTSINQHPVTNLKQYRDALKAADTKKGIIVNMISDGTAKFEILKEGAQ